MGDPQLRSPVLFVYGTLLSGRDGELHPYLAGRATLVGTGTISGALFDAGRYPAAVASREPKMKIRGEVYAIFPASARALLALLDRYEGCLPGRPAESLFIRTRVEVRLDAGGSVPAWTYLFNRSTDGLKRIADGDFAAHLARGSGRTGGLPAPGERR